MTIWISPTTVRLSNMTLVTTDTNSSTVGNTTQGYAPEYTAQLSTLMITFIVCMIILAVMGFIGNILILFYFPGNLFHSFIANYFIRTLAGLDLLTCVIIIPYSIMFELSKINNRTACKCLEFLRYFLVGSSLLTLLAISIERYFVVCHPFKAFSSRQAYVVLITCMCVAFVFSLPAIQLYDLYDEEIADGVFALTCKPGSGWLKWVHGLVLLLGFVMVIITLFALYGQLYYTILFKRWIQPSFNVTPVTSLPEIHTTKEDSSSHHNVKNGGCFQITAPREPTCMSPGPCLFFSRKAAKRNASKCASSNAGFRQSCCQSERSRSYMQYLEVPSLLNIRRNHRQVHPLKEHDPVYQQHQVNNIPQSRRSCWNQHDSHKTIRTETSATPQIECQLSPNQHDSHKTIRTETSEAPQIKCQLTTMRSVGRGHYKLASMLFGVSLIFILSWIPFWLTKLKVISYEPLLHYLFFVNNATNVFVYIIFCSSFRAKLKAVLCPSFPQP